jgi:uncharacterized protein (UPF0548 family)
MRAAELTYAQVHGTEGHAPTGYHAGSHRQVIGRGRGDFERAAVGLRTWQPQRSIGANPFGDPQVATGETVMLVLGVGPVEARICCRIVSVRDTDTEFGFTYGTLPCHPEIGEERFNVTLEPTGDVVFTIDVFWRSSMLITKLGGPITTLVQGRATKAYLDGLQRWVGSASR